MKQLELFENEQNDKTIPFEQITPTPYKGLASFHKYWGKKPVEYWKFLALNLTKENDVVLDPFLGSGLISKEILNLGRRFIGVDINPISIELSKLYNDLPSLEEYRRAIGNLEERVKPEIEKTYFLHDNMIATHYLWEKDKLFLIWRKASKNSKKQEYEPSQFDIDLFKKFEGYEPRNFSEPQFYSNSRINSKKDLKLKDVFTGRALHNIDLLLEHIYRQPESIQRALLLTLTSAIGQMSKMVFAVTNRRKNKGEKSNRIEVGSWVIGFWRPKLHFEINVWNCFENKAYRFIKAISNIKENGKLVLDNDPINVLNNKSNISLIEGDAKQVIKHLPDSSIQLVLTDPPHGDRMPYLELSSIWNSILRSSPNFEDEIVVSNAKERNKTVADYNKDIYSFFAQCERVVKQNGFMALMFNARSKEHWESLRSLEKNFSLFKYLGCFPANYSAGSVVQDNRKGGLRSDFILIFVKSSDDKFVEKTFQFFSYLDEWQSDYPKIGN